VLANCAGMNIPPSEALNMTLWQYEATLVTWNKLHEPDPQPDPMTVPEFQAMEQYFADNPHLLH
jgi:hypothetical protein